MARRLFPGETMDYEFNYPCFCGSVLKLRKKHQLRGNNLATALEALPEHQGADGAHCPHSGERPRLDPNPHERVLFEHEYLPPQRAAEKIKKMVSRNADLFGESGPPAQAGQAAA